VRAKRKTVVPLIARIVVAVVTAVVAARPESPSSLLIAVLPGQLFFLVFAVKCVRITVSATTATSAAASAAAAAAAAVAAVVCANHRLVYVCGPLPSVRCRAATAAAAAAVARIPRSPRTVDLPGAASSPLGTGFGTWPSSRPPRPPIQSTARRRFIDSDASSVSANRISKQAGAIGVHMCVYVRACVRRKRCTQWESGGELDSGEFSADRRRSAAIKETHCGLRRATARVCAVVVVRCVVLSPPSFFPRPFLTPLCPSPHSPRGEGERESRGPGGGGGVAGRRPRGGFGHCG